MASKTSCARHRHLHRLAGLLREQRRQRLEVDADLAAEAAADLHRHDRDLRDRDAAAWSASWSRTLNGACVLLQTVRWPSRVPVGRWRCAARCSPGGTSAVVNSRSTTTSASAKPFSTSPVSNCRCARDVGRLVVGASSPAASCPGAQVVVQDRRAVAPSPRARRAPAAAPRTRPRSAPSASSAMCGVGGRDGGDGVPAVEHLVARQEVVA